MSRRGRPRTGLNLCLDRVEEIAKLHGDGLGTTEIQSKLGGNRHAISRVKAILRAAEERGYLQAAEDTQASECGSAPFCKCSSEVEA